MSYRSTLSMLVAGGFSTTTITVHQSERFAGERNQLSHTYPAGLVPDV